MCVDFIQLNYIFCYALCFLMLFLCISVGIKTQKFMIFSYYMLLNNHGLNNL